MRVRRLLYLIAIVGIIAVLMGAAALYSAIRHLDAINIEQDRAQITARRMSSLLVLTEEYVLDRNERAARQWWVRHGELRAGLADDSAAIAETMPIRVDLLERHARIGEIFKLITDVKIDFDAALNERRTAMLVGQLIGEVEGMGEDAYRWGIVTEGKRIERQKMLRWAGFSLGAVLILLLAIVVWIASRRLILPLARLEAATRAVSQGQLSHRLDEGSRDEFGDVARAFNAMTGTLESQSAELASAYRKSQQEVERAKQAMRHFDSLFAFAPGALIVIDTVGTITKANEKAHELFGYESQALLGAAIGMLLPAQENITETGGWKLAVAASADQTRASKESFSGLRANGSPFLVEITVKPQRLDGISSTIVALWDVTEQHQLQQSMKLAKEMAEAASRAKSEFVANMSHEIRTPMNAVLGMTYLLNNTPLSLEQKKYLDMIRVAGESLLEILNDVLDFSKIEAGRMDISSHRFTLDDVLKKLATIMMVNAGEKDLELAIGVEPVVAQAYIGDALRIQQVLINLTGNAIKFTEHGEVSLHIDSVEHGDGTATLRFSVRDSGIGMDAEQQSRLFSAFSQADESTTRRFGGTGLGLAITKRLIDMMGGTIDVSSELGKGSEFCVSLRLKIAPDDQNLPVLRGQRLGPLRVLVVDDNETSRRYLSKTIKAWHWQAESVDTGAAALDRIKAAGARNQPYDVILVDWQMPAMDGLLTMQAIRELNPPSTMPIIIMVNVFGRNQLMEKQAASKADAILIKPVTGSSLFDTLHEILAERGARADAAEPSNSSNPPAVRVVRQPSERVAPNDIVSPIKGIRVLLVEDNALNQLLAKALLEPLGVAVVIMPNGARAVEHLRANPDAHDVVLMDVQMPVMDGFTATDLIRNELKLTLPVIAMTAGVMESERDRCITAGMSDFIAKPIDVEEMIATIGRHTTAVKPAAHVAPAARMLLPADSLPAFDVDRFSVVMQGDAAQRRSVLKILTAVIAQESAPIDEAYIAWTEKRTTDCTRLLHTLRGTIGTLGAARLADATLELEKVIASNEWGRVESLFASAADALKDMIEAAQAWLDTQRCDVNDGEAGADSVSADQIAHFDTLLSERDMAAYETYISLKQALQSYLDAAQSSALDNAMERLQFAVAREIVTNLKPDIRPVP